MTRPHFFGIVLLSLVLTGAHWARAPDGQLRLDLLNIGQGDAILVTLPGGERLLVDGGPEQTVLRELGEVMPFMDRRIDLVVLTHPHEDHVAGLVPVLRRYDVGVLLIAGSVTRNAAYEALLATAREREIPIEMARADRDLTFEDATLDVLYPLTSQAGRTIENVNNASVVIMVRAGPYTLLLTGDAEREVEEELLAAGADLDADVLKVGHHGSRSSSTPAFLDAVTPNVALISCGVDNSYKHPHHETLEALEDRDVQVHRTDAEGRVRLTFEGP